MRIKEPKFSIGERVYHLTRDSDEGIVTDITYHLRYDCFIYSVTFVPGASVDMYEDEISKTKFF